LTLAPPSPIITPKLYPALIGSPKYLI